MIFGRTKLELKVGVFVFIGLAILISFVLLIGSFQTWTSGYRVRFVFNFVNGVKIGAPVRFAGVDAGEVQNIKLEFIQPEQKTKVYIECWLKENLKVPLDSTVWVNTLWLLGEKYIEIIPGKDYSRYLASGGELIGYDPLPMHEVTELAKRIAHSIDETMGKIASGQGTLGRLLSDDTLYKEIEAAVQNKNGTIGRLFYDDSIYKEMEDLISDIKKHPWKLLFKGKEAPEKKRK